MAEEASHLEAWVDESGPGAWGILEAMGHRRIPGKIYKVMIAGVGFMRVDKPIFEGGKEEPVRFVSQFYRADAIYCLTPSDEASVFELSRPRRFEPVNTLDYSPDDHDDDPIF